MVTKEQIEESKRGVELLRTHKDYQSLEEIPIEKYFPDYIFEECNSAALFFSSWYQGKNDAIHFYNNNFKEVLVNDIAKMEIMEKLYPNYWDYKNADAFTLVDTIERKYDVVTCDTAIGTKCLYYDIFTSFYNIAGKYLCLYGNDVHLNNLSLSPNPDIISEKLSSHHNTQIKVKEVFRRPDSRQPLNYYWVIIEKE